ncbi:MAG: class I SAM-dependent rRNA methyltransferase, partial [Elusimicrobia bacterium]|nr:class I SAM-dependent rRNA methyltransferase [Elusimicrobiota bacterium]
MKPPSASTLPKIILKPGEENRLLAGHPWIFSNEIARGELNLEPGSLCCVENSLGENLGVGFYHPHSLIAIRVLAKGVDCLPSDFFLIKIKEALQFRQNLFTGERSFRLCFGESDGLPGLILDEYEDYVVGQILSVGIERFWDQIQSVLVDILAPKGIFLRNDNEMRRLEGLSLESRVAYGSIPERVQISEEGVQYIVPLMGGQKTGFYFDQRENRIFLRPYFNKRKVLDLHCYVGAFALNAAKFGAEEVWG